MSRVLIPLTLIVLGLLGIGAQSSPSTMMVRGKVTTLADGDNKISTGFADRKYAYFGTHTSPGRVVKFRSADMIREDSLSFEGSSGLIAFSVTDGVFGYFGVLDSAGIVKVRLSDMVQIEKVDIPGEIVFECAAIDDKFIYIASNYREFNDGIELIKVSLADFTISVRRNMSLGFQHISSLHLADSYLYAGTETSPAQVLKIRKIDLFLEQSRIFPQVSYLKTMISVEKHLYIGTYTTPGTVVKVRMSDLEMEKSIVFDESHSLILTSLSDGVYGYFGGNQSGSVVQVKLKDMTTVTSFSYSDQVNGLVSAALVKNKAYFASFDSPGKIVDIETPLISTEISSSVPVVGIVFGVIGTLVAIFGGLLLLRKAFDPSPNKENVTSNNVEVHVLYNESQKELDESQKKLDESQKELDGSQKELDDDDDDGNVAFKKSENIV